MGRAAYYRRRRTRGAFGISATELRLVVLLGVALGLLYTEAPHRPRVATTAPSAETWLGGGSFAVCSAAVRRNCVVDGDTFWTADEKIRIADIDTPETHPPRCAYEAELGDRATRRLSALLSAGPFELQSIDRDEDRYGRKLRIVMRDGRSIGDALVAEGLAREWTGRREPWCVREVTKIAESN